ncbi:hypothetical protein [Streptodolium elevatio]|uniref:Uncharacterized protein n=1 Tax=Streptodolium elevatio TaxID=3157996 RepID=A0ABV3DS05_9ACTN
MNPSVSDQLAAARRILLDLVRPHVDGEYPAALLTGVADVLAVLEQGWQRIPAFLTDDTARLRDLLARIADADVLDLPDGLRTRIAAYVAAPVPTAAALAELDAHAESGRALLAEAAPAVVAVGEHPVHDALRGYFDVRIAEFPLRPTPRA